jgi:uncharacterized protein (DUF488 family)
MAHPIYTIGYGAREIDGLCVHLQRWGVELVVDVRSQPYSGRRPSFSHKPLAETLGRHGIGYQHLPALGGRPKDPGCLTGGRVDYDKVRVQPFYREGIRELCELATQQRVAILCAEASPEACHRALLVAPTLVEAEVPVLHITPDGEIETHDQLLRRIAGGQRELFRAFPPPLD